MFLQSYEDSIFYERQDRCFIALILIAVVLLISELLFKLKRDNLSIKELLKEPKKYFIIKTSIILIVALVFLLQWLEFHVFYKYQFGTYTALLGIVAISILELLKRNNFSIKNALKKPVTYAAILLTVLFIAVAIYLNVSAKRTFDYEMRKVEELIKSSECKD